MASEDNYKMFNLKNREFTYTVDDSELDCGLNGALGQHDFTAESFWIILKSSM